MPLQSRRAMHSVRQSKRDALEKEATIAALEAMAQGEEIEPAYSPHGPKQKLSPLARTQNIRISGRTIRSGME